MSGDAGTAYAFLLQAMNTCALLDGHNTGRTDIKSFAEDLEDLFQDSRNRSHLRIDIQDLPHPSVDIVLGGWSWRRLRFEGYSYRFDGEGALHMHRLSDLDYGRPYGAYFFGDASASAKRRLREVIEERGLPRPQRGRKGPERTAEKQLAADAFLDWEPLEILQEIIADPAHDSVGGPPQVVRSYQYGASEGFVWSDTRKGESFGGRPLLEKERHDRRVIAATDGGFAVTFSTRSLPRTVEN